MRYTMLQACFEADLFLLYTSPAKCLKTGEFPDSSPGPAKLLSSVLCSLSGEEPYARACVDPLQCLRSGSPRTGAAKKWCPSQTSGTAVSGSASARGAPRRTRHTRGTAGQNLVRQHNCRFRPELEPRS